MEELSKGDQNSKSLLANVLGKDDDYILPTNSYDKSNFDYGSKYSMENANKCTLDQCRECSNDYYFQDNCYMEQKSNGRNAIRNASPAPDPHPPRSHHVNNLPTYVKCNCNGLQEIILKKELEAILREIQYITDKYRDEVIHKSLYYCYLNNISRNQSPYQYLIINRIFTFMLGGIISY